MSKLPHILFLTMLLFLGCETEGPSANAPKNLAYTIVASTQTAGLVDITVTADASNYFTLKLGQDPDAVLLNEPSGQFAHQFTQTGDYPVRIRAHSTFDIYVEVVGYHPHRTCEPNPTGAHHRIQYTHELSRLHLGLER